MEQLSWRSKANLVAYLQSVIVAVAGVLVVFFGLFLYMGPFPTHDTAISKQFKETTFAQKVSQEWNGALGQISDFERLVAIIFNWPLFDLKVQQYWVVFGVPIPTYICWIVYIIFVVATGVQWWIFICLTRALVNGTSSKDALSNAKNWRDVTAIFLVLGAILYFVCLFALLKTSGSLNYLCLIIFFSNIGYFSVNFICYSVIYKFITELEELEMQSTVCIEI